MHSERRGGPERDPAATCRAMALRQPPVGRALRTPGGLRDVHATHAPGRRLAPYPGAVPISAMIDIARKVALEAGTILMERFGRLSGAEIERHGRRDVTTAADQAAEQHITAAPARGASRHPRAGRGERARQRRCEPPRACAGSSIRWTAP